MKNQRFRVHFLPPWLVPQILWRCSRAAPPIVRAITGNCPPAGVASVTRALSPSLDGIVPPPAAVESFEWLRRPPDGTARARFYTDGSRLDGQLAVTARLGWSFVAYDEEGRIVAAARGVPPPWIVDIPGAEDWTILQAAMVAEAGSDFRVDCKPCVDAVHRGWK